MTYLPSALPDTEALTPFRENTASILKGIARTDRPLVITQNGRAAGVVVSAHVYKQLAEAAVLLHSIEQARLSIAEFHEGKARPLDEVFGDLATKYGAKTKKRRS